ncbi:MAG TPA: ATP-dependent metallopeptidase FtsH/Yme1/Tma family protein [Phycisphaerales bacterium]|nr:ATP-dependent metallopeptidase FtsH/Yme1/Tma family protein [Phycisphaerales bacterium]
MADNKNNPSDGDKDKGKGPAGEGPGSGKGPVLKFNRSPFGWLVIGLVLMSLMMVASQFKKAEELSYIPQFVDYLDAGHIKSVKFEPTQISGTFNAKGMESRGKKPLHFRVFYSDAMKEETLLERCRDKGVIVEAAKPDIIGSILVSLLPIILLIGIIYFVFLRNMKAGGGGMLMNFGRSKHRLRGKDDVKVTFADVAGIEEAKAEVAETIDFLKNPKKFKKIGGRIPRGVLLVGPPGCGKTLLAKAIAGESDVPFFSISGSDFVEMFVGVGASRVRDLFKQAKENSPCIIFLDEIDAIGRKRGPGFSTGGHDEREQTLNAILVEMDGFDTDDQIIVIAATNRGDILDHALTRPGRFDRQVVVPLPDLKGRFEILKIHAAKIKLGPDVNFERVARGTPMFSGAELEALINEAAISASMADKDFVELEDLEEARDKVRWGRAKKSRVVDEQDKRLTAFHEAGHALIQHTLEDADPLHKVSIIPRGPMGGATFSLPEKDRTYYTRKYCMAQMQVCFGGRLAEEMFCDDISSGAQSDILQATMMAKEMILTWGMGEELGPINYSSEPDPGSYFPMMGPDYSQKTAELIDKEVRKIIDEAYVAAKNLIADNKENLQNLADALIKYETLDAADVQIVLEGKTLDKPTVSDLLAMEQAKKESKGEGSEEVASSDEGGEKEQNDEVAEPQD